MTNILNVLIATFVLVLAIVIDLLFGTPDPNYPQRLSYRLHPSVLMGKLTEALESRLRNVNPRIERLNGVVLALTVIIAFVLPVYFGLKLIYVLFGYLIYAFIAAVILKLTIAIKLETEWAKAAAKAIESGDLGKARKYSHFSRREARDLNGQQIASSIIESMAENLTDFKLSPIFYYAFLGVPAAIAFKAINTLDGIVGFKDPEHIHIGWFSATLDTAVNYVPSRLVTGLIVIAAAILGENYKKAWSIAHRDQAKVPSRNHGWQMAAMAGALNVQLEKPDHYAIGDPIEKVTPDTIMRALEIRKVAIILFIILILPILIIINFFLFPY